MKNEVKANTSLCFVYNDAHVGINHSDPLKISYYGHFWERQRVDKWNGVKGCGCYVMSTNSTILSMQHTVRIRNENGTYQIDAFSLLKFSKLYLSGDIPSFWNLYMLQINQASINLFESMEKYMTYINDNWGFTVFGWYNRGVINDKSPISAWNIDGGGNIGNHNHNNENEEV